MDRRALYNQFLKRFPIENLGKMTLEEYTNLNRDNSFCYWLESKTQELGSIWGGSSYKFGIYRYEKRPDNPTVVVSDDEYAWYKKYNASNKEEAFKVVLNSIIGIAESAQKGDFQAIEEDSTFGNVVKWKIAFLYANEMLLPFYKREMLEKIASEYGYSNPSKAKIYELQHFLMEQKGDKDLYDFSDELLSIMNKEQADDNKRYWMYAPGEKASKWQRCIEQNIICIGWDALGDLSAMDSLEECREELKNAYNKPDASFMNDGLAVWEFSHVMQPGDIVFAKQGQSGIIGRGIVKSDYFYDPSHETYRHTRKVEWTHIGNWELENIVQKTLTDITKYPDYVKKIEAMITNSTEDMSTTQYQHYIDLLLNNRNLILNGAPGTGKTYFAKLIAAHIIFDGNIPDNFEEHPQFVEQCGFVQFHPSYDYTDFVEGLRPTRPNQDGNIGFERKDGIFKAFCKKAASQDANISIKPQVNLELVRKTDDNPTSFMEVYQKLVNDIRSGNAVLYSDFRSKMTTIKLRVDRINGIDIIKFWKTKDFQNAQYDYLKRIYDYYYSRGIFDIRDKRFEDFVKIIGNTLDYSYYRGIVQGLLDRTDRGATTKVPLSNLHVDRDKDYNVDLSPQPYIFIIDEINRGEISKIFGELFFSIDPGYRGVKGKVQTQYQNLITEDDPFKDGFYIPENVYIIGTMNDIDRSVECMDFAMRRRFTFKEITAEESARNMELGAEATERMMSLNNAISEIDGFNSSFHIGAAYFKGVDDFDALWELKLAGLLKEYLRGMPDAEESLEALKKAYDLNEE